MVFDGDLVRFFELVEGGMVSGGRFGVSCVVRGFDGDVMGVGDGVWVAEDVVGDVLSCVGGVDDLVFERLSGVGVWRGGGVSVVDGLGVDGDVMGGLVVDGVGVCCSGRGFDCGVLGDVLLVEGFVGVGGCCRLGFVFPSVSAGPGVVGCAMVVDVGVDGFGFVVYGLDGGYVREFWGDSDLLSFDGGRFRVGFEVVEDGLSCFVFVDGVRVECSRVELGEWWDGHSVLDEGFFVCRSVGEGDCLLSKLVFCEG